MLEPWGEILEIRAGWVAVVTCSGAAADTLELTLDDDHGVRCLKLWAPTGGILDAELVERPSPSA